MTTAPEVPEARVPTRTEKLLLNLRRLRRRVTRPTTWKLTWLAGFALIAVGILCLSLSGTVARTGTWWQGTWQALGVGFVVGGIVDVLAISAMSQFSSASQRRWNDEASAIVFRARTAKYGSRDSKMLPAEAEWLVRVHGDVLDPGLRGELRLLAESLPPNATRRAD